MDIHLSQSVSEIGEVRFKNCQLLTSEGWGASAYASGEQVPPYLPAMSRCSDTRTPWYLSLVKYTNHNFISASKHVNMGHHHTSRDKIFILSSSLQLLLFPKGFVHIFFSYHVSWGFLVCLAFFFLSKWSAFGGLFFYYYVVSLGFPTLLNMFDS